MSPKRLHSDSDISIQKVKSWHLDQVADIYYSHMRGDFVGSCGRYVFINYLKYLSKSQNGFIWCAVNTEDRVIGFGAGVIDDQYMNWKWVLMNLTLLCPLVILSFLFSHDFRVFLYRRICDKFQDSGKISASHTEKKSMHGKRIAHLKWLVVDKKCRGAGIGSRLFTSLENDAREKGVDQIFSLIEKKNTASKTVHLKNGWEIFAENKKRIEFVKKIV